MLSSGGTLTSHKTTGDFLGPKWGYKKLYPLFGRKSEIEGSGSTKQNCNVGKYLER